MRLLLIHWDDDELRTLAEDLRVWGHEVVHGVTSLTKVREAAPDAFVISLRKQPAHGRETALAFRRDGWSKSIPLFFADGMPDKVDQLMDEFEHARFVSWDELEGALSRAHAFDDQLARTRR